MELSFNKRKGLSVFAVGALSLLLGISFAGIMVLGNGGGEEWLNNYTIKSPTMIIDVSELVGEDGGFIVPLGDGSLIVSSQDNHFIFKTSSANNTYEWRDYFNTTYERCLYNNKVAISDDGSLTLVVGEVSDYQAFSEESQRNFVMAYGPNGTILWEKDITQNLYDDNWNLGEPRSVSVSSHGEYVTIGTSNGLVLLLNGANGDLIYRFALPVEMEVDSTLTYSNDTSLLLFLSTGPYEGGDFLVYNITSDNGEYNKQLVLDYDSDHYLGPIFAPHLDPSGRYLSGIADHTVDGSGFDVSFFILDTFRPLSDDALNPNPLYFSVQPVNVGESYPIAVSEPIIGEDGLFIYGGFDNGTVIRLDVRSDVIPGPIPQYAWYLNETWRLDSNDDFLRSLNPIYQGLMVLIGRASQFDIVNGTTGELNQTINPPMDVDDILFSKSSPAVAFTTYMGFGCELLGHMSAEVTSDGFELTPIWTTVPNVSLSMHDGIKALKTLQTGSILTVTEHGIYTVDPENGEIQMVWNVLQYAQPIYSEDDYPPSINGFAISDDGSYLVFTMSDYDRSERTKVLLIESQTHNIIWETNLTTILSNITGRQVTDFELERLSMSINNGSWISMHLKAYYTYWNESAGMHRDDSLDKILIIKGLDGNGNSTFVMNVDEGDVIESQLLTNNNLLILILNHHGGEGGDHGEYHPMIPPPNKGEGEAFNQTMEIYSITNNGFSHRSSINLEHPLMRGERSIGSIDATRNGEKIAVLEYNTTKTKEIFPHIALYGSNSDGEISHLWSKTLYVRIRGHHWVSLTPNGDWLSLMIGRNIVFYNTSDTSEEPLWLYSNNITVYEDGESMQDNSYFMRMHLREDGGIYALDKYGVILYFNNTFYTPSHESHNEQGRQNQTGQSQEHLTHKQKEKLHEFHNETPIIRKQLKELTKLVRELSSGKGNKTEAEKKYNETMNRVKSVFEDLVDHGLVNRPPTTGMSEATKNRLRTLLESRYGPMLENYPSLMGRLYLIVWLYG